MRHRIVTDCYVDGLDAKQKLSFLSERSNTDNWSHSCIGLIVSLTDRKANERMDINCMVSRYTGLNTLPAYRSVCYKNETPSSYKFVHVKGASILNITVKWPLRQMISRLAPSLRVRAMCDDNDRWREQQSRSTCYKSRSRHNYNLTSDYRFNA